MSLPERAISRPVTTAMVFVAIVVIGGLVSSTLLTLFLLPTLYRRYGVAHPGA